MSHQVVSLRYGHEDLSVSVPRQALLGIFVPENQSESLPDEAALICSALENPIGTPKLRDMARPGQQVAIVTSDITRPCPSARMLPHILDELATAGVPDQDITIILALGSHRPMTKEEMETAVGPEVYARVRTINHDPDDTMQLGITSRGTPIDIFRPLIEADLRVCLGNVGFHYFAGFSGGAKAVFPGCSSLAAIRHNHAMMVRPDAASGRLEGNPLRVDLEEAAAKLGIDFILNVALDSCKHIIDAAAGDVHDAHRALCQPLATRGTIPIPHLADIVLASACGFPTDINLYQAHKALENASAFAKDGGIVVLAARCSEGYGNPTFETWIREANSPADILERIKHEFVIGGHKAAAIAAILSRVSVYLVSDMPNEDVERIGMIPFESVEAALNAALENSEAGSQVLILPEATYSLPRLS